MSQDKRKEILTYLRTGLAIGLTILAAVGVITGTCHVVLPSAAGAALVA